MAHWDSENNMIIHSKPQKCALYPGWEIIDCGCCNGVEWGGEYPRECKSCGGGGFVFHHITSGILAMYPGGPFVGGG